MIVSMARIAVITDGDTALGFRLAGVDAFDVSSDRDAEVLIERFLRNREYEIVAYSEEYLPLLSDSLKKRVEESTLPVFISVPSVMSSREGGEGKREEEYIARVLQRALGFYVKIRK